MPIPNEECIRLWRLALTEPIGLSVESTDRYYLSQNLYQARRQSNDQDIQFLGLIFPPNQNELWIVRKANAKDSGRAFEEGDVEPIRKRQETVRTVLRPGLERASEDDC